MSDISTQIYTEAPQCVFPSRRGDLVEVHSDPTYDANLCFLPHRVPVELIFGEAEALH